MDTSQLGIRSFHIRESERTARAAEAQLKAPKASKQHTIARM